MYIFLAKLASNQDGGCAVALEGAGVSNCDFIAGDAYDLARPWPKSVDFVFLANAFHGVREPTRLPKSIEAALKPAGLFAIVNWHARPREGTTILGEPRGPKTELRVTAEKKRSRLSRWTGSNFRNWWRFRRIITAQFSSGRLPDATTRIGTALRVFSVASAGSSKRACDIRCRRRRGT
jgi:SAM-dependent methyltransferase